MLAGAVPGAVAAIYAWDHWIPHPACAPGDGRYRFLNCLSLPPPVWLDVTMMVIGVLVALTLRVLFTRWRSSLPQRSAT